MKRRTLLATLATGPVVSTSGCIGGGGEVVTTVQRSVDVLPGSNWVKRIPDVSNPGGAIQYTAKASEPFDVYFFLTEDAFLQYDAAVDGDDPEQTPAGDADVGMTARQRAKDSYRASTQSNGAREPITESGPYFFVIDHSGYRGETPPGEDATELSVFLDLTVSKKRFGI